MEALATLTKEVTSLPYEEQKALLSSLSASIMDIERRGALKRTHEENLALVKSFMDVRNPASEVQHRMAVLERLQKFRGRLPADFDADKELAEAREEKYSI